MENSNFSQSPKQSLKNLDTYQQTENGVKRSPGHNTFVFYVKNQFGYSQEIVFDANFDSGNLMHVEKVNNFSVKSPELYKPVYKVKNGDWKRLENPVNITKEDNIDVSFEYSFQNSSDIVSFAFSYPYTYTECMQFSQQLFTKFQNDQDFYFHKETLVKSYQKRNLDLITISSREGKLEEKEDRFDPALFPEFDELQNRPHKFRQNKPVILLSARVHPSESPSSFSMKGILKFLTDKKDARAMLLRKYFVIKIIPMLNPDGVYNGHYRMDTFGQNLNRFYSNPDIEKQPSCYAVRKLTEYMHNQKRLVFYCDLHAHQGKKGCFFYGNAIDDYVMQVESQVFAKVMSLNCLNFEYDDCNFSKKQMTSKDRREAQTKEGSGRVTMYKTANLIHSYTLECGFHLSNYIIELAHPNQIHRKQNGPNNKVYGFTEDEIDNSHSELYKNGPPYYTMEIFENIGKNLLVSILDVFDKNPYSRIPNSNYKTMDAVRKEVAQQVAKLDRFKKEDSKLSMKCKKISEQVNENFYNQFIQNGCFNIDAGGSRNKSLAKKSGTRVIRYQVGSKRNSTGFMKNTKDLLMPSSTNSSKNAAFKRESKTSENKAQRQHNSLKQKTNKHINMLEQKHQEQLQQQQQQIQGKNSPQNHQIYKVNLGFNGNPLNNNSNVNSQKNYETNSAMTTNMNNNTNTNANNNSQNSTAKSPHSSFNYLSNFNSALQLYNQKENQMAQQQMYNMTIQGDQQPQQQQQKNSLNSSKYKFTLSNVNGTQNSSGNNSSSNNGQFYYKNANGNTNVFYGQKQQNQQMQNQDLSLNMVVFPAKSAKFTQQKNGTVKQFTQFKQQSISQRGNSRKKEVLALNNLNNINKQYLKGNQNVNIQQKFIIQQQQKQNLINNNPVLQMNNNQENAEYQYIQSKIMKFPEIQSTQYNSQQTQQTLQNEQQQLNLHSSQQTPQQEYQKMVLKVKVPTQQQKIFSSNKQQLQQLQQMRSQLNSIGNM